MKQRRNREPPAPTPLDEAMSLQSLESSPWIKQRIKDLRLEGRPAMPYRTHVLCVRHMTRVAIRDDA